MFVAARIAYILLIVIFKTDGIEIDFLGFWYNLISYF